MKKVAATTGEKIDDPSRGWGRVGHFELAHLGGRVLKTEKKN